MVLRYKNYRTIKKDLLVAITGGLLVSLFAWSFGFQYLQTAHAAGSLSSISDTLSESRPSYFANHTIVFTNPTSTIAAGQTITYTFDPLTNAFGTLAGITLANVTSTGMTIVSSCSAGTANVTMTTSTNVLTFTMCGADTGIVPSTTVTLRTIGAPIQNPSSTGSYIIRLGGTQPNGGDTRIAVVNGVNVTAAIATTFTFTVSSLPTSTTLGNNATTTGNDSSTTLPFGTITPNTHNELGQQLNVTTNASNGFAVTIHEDQDMMSSKGNTIHLFSNANATSTPSPWTSPTNIINNPLTYGHLGITSDDTSSTVVGGPSFGTSTPLYAGSFNPTSTLMVFGWNGPADGVTQNVGAAKVAVRLEIGSLQAAGNDYSNNLIYVATPVF
jgi:hypothetical protein